MVVKFSIVLPSFNHLTDLLKPCIESVQKYTDLTDGEVIVVANGCTDGTKEYVESLGSPFKLIWIEEAVGYTKATNEGIKASNSEFIVLLNNDVVILPQEKHTWIRMLLDPFADQKVAVTGPLLGYSGPANRNFVVFFCAAVRRVIFDRIGLLDEIFTPGGGEDTDFCVRAENAGYKIICTPIGQTQCQDGIVVGGFPIYHKGEGTVLDPKCVQGWQEIFDRNSQILRERYNYQLTLGNDFERAVISAYDKVPPREHARYSWARKNVVGTRILEIGCSSGYGYRYLRDIEGLEYLGIDKDPKIIEFAKKNFERANFQVDDVVERFKEGKSGFEFWDTIIAFEILEHVPNGKELAQELKKHCKCLLTTVPYKEVPGMWGRHHVLHGLNERDFPNFQKMFIRENGEIQNTPDRFDGMNLMLMRWTEGMKEVDNTVTATISTKDRYYTTLPYAIMSVVNQSHKVNRLIIYDDGEHKDLREDPLYKYIFSMLQRKGIQWEFVFGERKGQVANHQKAIEMADTEWIWRIDDDEIAEFDVLEKLLSVADENTGAVGGLILDPTMVETSKLASNKIEDIYLGLNIQWFKHKNVSGVDHLYSSFIYRKKAANHGYCKYLSKAGHREETIFTYEMKRNGWKLLVNPEAITWHYRNPEGGIRSFRDKSLWEHDEAVFQDKLKLWGITPKMPKMVVLDCGLGDHLAFKSVFPEVKKKYGSNLIVAHCYPEIFEDEKDITLISIADAKTMVNTDEYNIYKFMTDRQWKKSLAEAFKEFYA